MLVQFFRHQLQRERPTISATVRRESGQMNIGANMRLDVISDVSSDSTIPVITVMGRYGYAPKKA